MTNPDPVVEQIVRDSVKRFEDFLGMWATMARSNGWMTEFENEVRRVATEARKK
jgi:hypothetical protein